MSGKPSSSQHLVFSESDALSHVYIQFPPLRCRFPGLRKLFYDDGNKLLLALTSDQVFSWKIAPFDPHIDPVPDPVSEGPVVSMRYSFNSELLAIQRSSQELHIWNKKSGQTFSQKCRFESESILGFFWTDCRTCDLVIVKTSGLELFSYNNESKSVNLVETKKMNVSWYIYTHESRLVLLSSGMQCKSLTGFQLSTVGIIRLPRFEMAMAKYEANSKPVLAAEDVHIVTVYGRIYCLQLDRVAMQLHSYRFYRDAVVQQGSLPIYSSKIAVSVVDNILLIHQVDAKVVIIYDIFDDSSAPLSAPLPLLFRGSNRTHRARSQTLGQSVESSGSNYLSDTEAIIYGDDWTFLVPDLVCDVANALLWKIHIDLEAISASSSELASVLEFLQRRRLEANKAKQLCMGIMRTAILERRPVAMVAKGIDVLITSYANSLKSGSNYRGGKSDKTSHSSSSNVHNHTDTVDESTIPGHTSKSIKRETTGPLERESSSRSIFSASDSEENISFKPEELNINSHETSSAKPDGESWAGAEAHASSARFQVSGGGSSPLNANAPDQQEAQVASAAVSPDDLYSFVFIPIEEEMAEDASYLLAIIIELLRSANAARIRIRSNIYVLMIQLLARSECYAELGLYITNKILEPSKEVALQLIESGQHNSPTRKLGLDMLRQLSLHHDYVLLLVQDGYYLEALRYARKYKVNTVQPSMFLESAYASNDSQHLAAILRFFSDFIPGFKSSSENNAYTKILAEMNTSITA
ncbi:hypothetical protein LIER_06921 [Lithospermum erythrorhizon]|uniref:Mic1 domain-containing protein n=1 Tax=Lithospermum erythrorhizon TaxID=34254 RepID=A0AAV3PAK7_LITER